MLCMTVDEFERQERRWKRERARELAGRGLSWRQIGERLGVSPGEARSMARGRRRPA